MGIGIRMEMEMEVGGGVKWMGSDTGRSNKSGRSLVVVLGRIISWGGHCSLSLYCCSVLYYTINSAFSSIRFPDCTVRYAVLTALQDMFPRLFLGYDTLSNKVLTRSGRLYRARAISVIACSSSSVVL